MAALPDLPAGIARFPALFACFPLFVLVGLFAVFLAAFRAGLLAALATFLPVVFPVRVRAALLAALPTALRSCILAMDGAQATAAPAALSTQTP